MATTIFFNGRVISVPGSYSQVDASGLESVGLGAAGIVGVIGQAEGGRPVAAITETKDFIRINKPEKARTAFRSGDLREVADMLFAPGKDPDILGGAQELVCMKVNPATQSTAVLSNSYGNALDLTSKDYGAFTEQVNVAIASGTTKGKRVTILFEDVTEAGDDIGGDAMFKLKYTKPTNGWDTINGQVISGGEIKCLATRAQAGLDSEITDTAAPGVVEVLSANAADVGQKVTVIGLDGTGAVKREVLTLNGTTPVIGTQVFATAGVLGAYVSLGTTLGIVTVRVSPGGATIMSLAAGTGQTTAKGLKLGVCMYAAGAMTLVADGATTKTAILMGLDASGAIALEKFVLTGLVPVAGAATWSQITGIILGDVEAARTITISGTAAWAKLAVQKTLQKAADYFNARSIAGTGGFTFTMLTGQTSAALGILDVMPAAVSILAPAEPSFYADLNAVMAWINQNSQYVAAAISAGAYGGAPSNTAAPVFLAGGSEGTTMFADWQNALNLLKKTRVNTIVVLTPDPAVHAALDAHCAYMGGIGRSERDGVVGVMNAAMTDVATKDEVKSQIMDLNTRHIRAVAQAIERYNTAGERQEFTPPFHAALIAGMQAGSPVGTSLTHKYVNALAFRQHSSWNPTDDAEEMIQAGLCFLETVEGAGRRVVRNITTHLSSNNIAYIEASVNEAVNYAVYNFRTNMEFLVGKKGFAGTINAGRGVALNTLGLLVDAEVLVTYRSLDLELVVDVMDVSVEIAPVIPINFVKSTIHLVTVRQSAA
jgi:hypothetical protein